MWNKHLNVYKLHKNVMTTTQDYIEALNFIKVIFKYKF